MLDPAVLIHERDLQDLHHGVGSSPVLQQILRVDIQGNKSAFYPAGGGAMLPGTSPELTARLSLVETSHLPGRVKRQKACCPAIVPRLKPRELRRPFMYP